MPLDRSCERSILPQRNVRSHLIVIDGVSGKNPPKVFRVEHNQMIRALATDRSDQPFNISVLPRRMERGGSVPDPHRPQTRMSGAFSSCCNSSRFQDLAQMLLTECDDMVVDALATDRSDQPLGKAVLPWRTGRNRFVADARNRRMTAPP